MSLESRLADFITAIGADIKALLAGPTEIARREWSLLDDFQGEQQSVWAQAVSGTAAAVGSVGATDATSCGVIQLTTGSTATGRACLRTLQNSAFRLGLGKATYTARFRLPILSDATNRFAVRLGFGDTDGGDMVDGVYFEYDDSASANWRCKTASASTRTTTTTAVAVAVATWYRLEIEVNADGTEVKFYIDGTLVATHTANIPVGSGRDTGVGFWTVKSVGTTARVVQADWMGAKIVFTTPR